MRATMTEVAARAGVSTSTVSHIVNRTRFVDPDTTFRVLSAINQIGTSLQDLSRKKVAAAPAVWGVVVGDIGNPFYMELARQMEQVGRRLGFELEVADGESSPERVGACAERLVTRGAQGVAVMTSAATPALAQRLANCGVPGVYLGLESAGPLISSLGIDYERGVSEAVECLYALGHRNIVCISGMTPAMTQRTEAYALAMGARDLEPRVELAEHSLAGGEAVATRLFSETPWPTAVLAANDCLALGVLKAAHARGLRAPRDFSLIGFDNIHFAALCDPPLTTVAIPVHDLAAITGMALKQMMQRPQEGGRVYRVRTYLVERASTAACAG